MLVLTRKRNQQIRIGQDIVVRVVSVRGAAVQLGIQAPREVNIAREEIRDRRPAEAA
jgi:carbon storage regulator